MVLERENAGRINRVDDAEQVSESIAKVELQVTRANSMSQSTWGTLVF